jgi:hypothetical protein
MGWGEEEDQLPLPFLRRADKGRGSRRGRRRGSRVRDNGRRTIVRRTGVKCFTCKGRWGRFRYGKKEFFKTGVDVGRGFCG